MTTPLQAFKLKTLIAGLRDLEIAVSDKIRHVQMLQHSGESIEARTALETANRLELSARQLEQYLAGLAGEAEVISRSMSHRPPAQSGVSKFQSSDAGMLAELKPTAARIGKKLRDCADEIRQYGTQSNTRINDPGRYGTAAASVSINDLVDAIGSVLDAVARVHEEATAFVSDFRRMKACSAARLAEGPDATYSQALCDRLDKSSRPAPAEPNNTGRYHPCGRRPGGA